MAHVIGPNGIRTYVPDAVAGSLVGDGSRGYTLAPAPAEPAEAPAKKSPRRRAKSAQDQEAGE